MITEPVARAAPAHLLAAHVPDRTVVASLAVNVGGGRSADTRATVSLFFGRTELSASAVSKQTGDERKVSLNFEGAVVQPPPAVAAGARD